MKYASENSRLEITLKEYDSIIKENEYLLEQNETLRKSKNNLVVIYYDTSYGGFGEVYVGIHGRKLIRNLINSYKEELKKERQKCKVWKSFLKLFKK